MRGWWVRSRSRRSSRRRPALYALAALALLAPARAVPAAEGVAAGAVSEPGEPAASAREVVFVVDLSEAMRGEPLERAKKALTAALERLRPVDTFNVLALGERTRALFPASWPARPESLDKAARWIAGLETGGGAEVLEGLVTAVGPPDEGYATAGARPVREVVVFAPGAIGHPAVGPRAIGPVTAGEAPAAAPPASRAPSGGQAHTTSTAAGATASLLLRLGAGLALFAAALAYALRRGLAAPEAAR